MPLIRATTLGASITKFRRTPSQRLQAAGVVTQTNTQGQTYNQNAGAAAGSRRLLATSLRSIKLWLRCCVGR